MWGFKVGFVVASESLGRPSTHDDVIKWKHFPRYWPFVRGIHRSPVNSPHKGQWRGPLMFSLICAWINDWVNNGKAGDLRRHRAHYEVIVMYIAWNSLHRQIGSNYTCWMHNVGVQSGFHGCEWKARSPVNEWAWPHFRASVRVAINQHYCGNRTLICVLMCSLRLIEREWKRSPHFWPCLRRNSRSPRSPFINA